MCSACAVQCRQSPWLDGGRRALLLLSPGLNVSELFSQTGCAPLSKACNTFQSLQHFPKLAPLSKACNTFQSLQHFPIHLSHFYPSWKELNIAMCFWNQMLFVCVYPVLLLRLSPSLFCRRCTFQMGAIKSWDHYGEIKVCTSIISRISISPVIAFQISGQAIWDKMARGLVELWYAKICILRGSFLIWRNS